MKVFYDRLNRRLMFFKECASEDFWDRHWRNQSSIHDIFRRRPSWIINMTKRFLPPKSVILEGGCGLGDKVYWLKEEDFNVVGVDFAERTIKLAKSTFPELNVQKGDVRCLDFVDDHFDGYWSLGVIEHFFDGFDEIRSEMSRVLKPNGVLFITFPYLSPVRRIKALMGLYPIWDQSMNNDGFYQYAFDGKRIVCSLEDSGFKLVYRRPYDAYKGLKDELSVRIRNKYFAGAVNRTLFMLTSHIVLQVYRNTGSSSCK